MPWMNIKCEKCGTPLPATASSIRGLENIDVAVSRCKCADGPEAQGEVMALQHERDGLKAAAEQYRKDRDAAQAECARLREEVSTLQRRVSDNWNDRENWRAAADSQMRDNERLRTAIGKYRLAAEAVRKAEEE